MIRKLHEKFLNDRVISISLLKSSDMHRLGLGAVHLQDLLIESARYILSCGGRIAYGENLKYREDFNFINVLKELLGAYNTHHEKNSQVKLINYIPYPVYKLTDYYKDESLSDIVDFIQVPIPDELDEDLSTIIKRERVQDNYIYASSLTLMRSMMTREVDALLLGGGPISGFTGFFPCILEEAYLAMVQKKPIYLLGGLGGCARALIELLRGHKSSELNEIDPFQDLKYKELFDYYKESIEHDIGMTPLSYEYIINYFGKNGIKSLHNGLNRKENELLFEASDTLEIIQLVLKGLKQVFKK